MFNFCISFLDLNFYKIINFIFVVLNLGVFYIKLISNIFVTRFRLIKNNIFLFKRLLRKNINCCYNES